VRSPEEGAKFPQLNVESGCTEKSMAKICGLQTAFGDVASRVPDGPPGERDYVFRPDTLPEVPAELETDRVVLRKTQHDYNSWCRADMLMLYVESDPARLLGIWLLACLFHRPDRATIEFCHPSSQVRTLVFRSSRLDRDDPPVGLSLMPFAFRYYPGVTRKHPWWNEAQVDDLPLLALSNADDCIVTDDEWRARDTVFIESSLLGTVRLAELLLNAGCSWNQVRDYELEGDAGFRGVAPMSAELRIVMPGSLAWLPALYGLAPDPSSD